MEDINIRENKSTGGYCAVFKHDDTWHYADLSLVDSIRMYEMVRVPECMIFPCEDETGKEVDFGYEEYSSNPDEVSAEALQECIMEFIGSD